MQFVSLGLAYDIHTIVPPRKQMRRDGGGNHNFTSWPEGRELHFKACWKVNEVEAKQVPVEGMLCYPSTEYRAQRRPHPDPTLFNCGTQNPSHTA